MQYSFSDTRAVVVGMGLHGIGLSALLLERGGQIAGASDPRLAGRPLGEVLARRDDQQLSGLEVVAGVEELLGRVDGANLALIAAPVEIEELQVMTLQCFSAGMNVLTIHEDAFDPPAEWARLIDAQARAHGVSFLATGVQDVWWVHLPAVAAGSMAALTAVRARHAIDLEQASRGYGELLSLGEDPAVFAQIRDQFLLAGSSILGAPLRVLARYLGLTPAEIEREIEPVLASRALRWRLGERDIAPGTLAGFSEKATFETAEGVSFSGTFYFCLTDPDQPYDELVLEGDPTLRIEHRPFPGDRITDTIPIARIPDLIAAPPGLHSVTDFPPARYRHRAIAPSNVPN